MVLEVGREAMGDGGRRAHQKQFQRHRAANDVRRADDDAVAALHRHADVLEHPHHAVGRAGADQRVALGKAADVVRVEAVDILAWVDALHHLGLADVLGQRQLHEDAVDRRVGVQAVDVRQELRLGGRARQVDGDGVDAAISAGGALVAHIDLRGGIVAHHHHREPRRPVAACDPFGDPGADARAHGGSDGLAVNDLGGSGVHGAIFSHDDPPARCPPPTVRSASLLSSAA